MGVEQFTTSSISSILYIISEKIFLVINAD